MSAPLACFSIEELELLDAHQVELLKNAIEREIRTSPEIRAILRSKYEAMFARMAAGQPPPGGPPRGRGARARRSRAARKGHK